jgi:hypothetical protein
MDGGNTDDYLERVEPSVQGGKKMAERFVDLISEVQGPLSRASDEGGLPTSDGRKGLVGGREAVAAGSAGVSGDEGVRLASMESFEPLMGESIPASARS